MGITTGSVIVPRPVQWVEQGNTSFNENIHYELKLIFPTQF